MAPQAMHLLPFVERYVHFDTIGSTNDYAKGLDVFPQTGIFVFHADIQTNGRGQRGNSFFSGDGGLYASFVCPIADIGSHFVLNRAVSLAIVETLAHHDAGPLSVKWPNDILRGGKKICGILLESVNRSAGHIVIGFGINVNTTANALPEEIRETATSMFIETGAACDTGLVLYDICNRFERLRFLPSLDAHERYIKLLHGIGRVVGINGQTGIFEGVTEDGQLIMSIDGISQYFSSGPLYFK
jgi:BirA family transcriptional regulator, biotin operon repressor / biotin---[acetyl-CoA-carboxylase] ligase